MRLGALVARFNPRQGFLSSSTLTRHSATLDRLHTPVATSRRIAFIQCGSAPTAPVINAIAGALQTVPGRRVATTMRGEAPGAPQRHALPNDERNADVVLTDLGSFTHLAEVASAGVNHHALCIVASSERTEADPALALAKALAEEAGLRTVVAFGAPARSTRSSRRSGWAAHRWARLTAARAPEQVVYLPSSASRAQLSIATLAGILLNATTESPPAVPTPAEVSA